MDLRASVVEILDHYSTVGGPGILDRALLLGLTCMPEQDCPLSGEVLIDEDLVVGDVLLGSHDAVPLLIGGEFHQQRSWTGGMLGSRAVRAINIRQLKRGVQLELIVGEIEHFRVAVFVRILLDPLDPERVPSSILFQLIPFVMGLLQAVLEGLDLIIPLTELSLQFVHLLLKGWSDDLSQ